MYDKSAGGNTVLAGARWHIVKYLRQISAIGRLRKVRWFNWFCPWPSHYAICNPARHSVDGHSGGNQCAEMIAIDPLAFPSNLLQSPACRAILAGNPSEITSV